MNNGWDIFNTSSIGSTSNTIAYWTNTGTAINSGYPLSVPAVAKEAIKPPTPLDWLHGRVDEICQLGMLPA